ncbi:MAG: hypothetical protein LWX56_09250 [Ignavibacteria bacterium]|nr:hypothetical protein [Ignavibacteria bacterium]
MKAFANISRELLSITGNASVRIIILCMLAGLNFAVIWGKKAENRGIGNYSQDQQKAGLSGEVIFVDSHWQIVDVHESVIPEKRYSDSVINDRERKKIVRVTYLVTYAKGSPAIDLNKPILIDSANREYSGVEIYTGGVLAKHTQSGRYNNTTDYKKSITLEYILPEEILDFACRIYSLTDKENAAQIIL